MHTSNKMYFIYYLTIKLDKYIYIFLLKLVIILNIYYYFLSKLKTQKQVLPDIFNEKSYQNWK